MIELEDLLRDTVERCWVTRFPRGPHLELNVESGDCECHIRVRVDMGYAGSAALVDRSLDRGLVETFVEAYLDVLEHSFIARTN